MNPHISTNLKKLLDIPHYARIINYFFSTFYWRLSIHDNYFKLRTEEKFLARSINRIINKNNINRDEDITFDTDFLTDVKDNLWIPLALGEEDNVMKIYKSFIHSFGTLYYDNNPATKLRLWSLPKQHIVSSDVPFINIKNNVSLNSKFIFTWSPSMVFINAWTLKNKKINVIEFCFKLSMMNYVRAKRYVFCNDKAMLDNVIRYYTMRYGNSGYHTLEKEFFDIFD